MILRQKQIRHCMYPRSREKDATACSVRKIRPLIRNYRLFVWSSSRNVTSMLEFALPEFVHLKKVISVEEIRENMGEKTGEDILGLFVDVSEEEDGGQARWQELGGLQRTCAFHDRHLQGRESCTDEMCVGDGRDPGSAAGPTGGKCTEAAVEDLDAKIETEDVIIWIYLNICEVPIWKKRLLWRRECVPGHWMRS